jgi:hypothetical protein
MENYYGLPSLRPLRLCVRFGSSKAGGDKTEDDDEDEHAGALILRTNMLTALVGGFITIIDRTVYV